MKGWNRLSRELPYIGYGLVPTDLGYDLTHEKPVDKTLVSAGEVLRQAAWPAGAPAPAGPPCSAWPEPGSWPGCAS